MEERINNLLEYKSIIVDKYKNCVYLSKLHEKSYEFYSFRFKLFRIFEVFSLFFLSISLIIYLFTQREFILLFSIILSTLIIVMVLYNKDYIFYQRYTMHKQAIDKFNSLADQYKNLKLDIESQNADYTYLRETLNYLNNEYYDCNIEMPRPMNYNEEMHKFQENISVDIGLNHFDDDGIIPKELKR
ncbi:MAG: SLATT domain-containing protein [Oscillospiraceae bacterium]|nr:SLATT domain-containing protein [Oscillospiraceae bacterium]